MLKIHCRTYQSIDIIEKIASLKEIDEYTDTLVIDNESCIKDLSFLRFFPNLSSLTLTRCPEITDISPIGDLHHIKRLNLAGSGSLHIYDFTPLSSLKKLTYLDLSYMQFLYDLDFLAPLLQIEELHLNFCSHLIDIKAVEHLVHMKTLHIKECPHVEESATLFQKKILERVSSI